MAEQHVTVGTGTHSDGSTYDILEAQYATTRRGFHGPWFVCPINGNTLPKSEGVKIKGVYYSPQAAQDILASEAKKKKG